MEYKVNIFSLVIITGILGSCLMYGKAVSSDPRESGGGICVNFKNDVQCDGLFLSHTVSQVKKHSTNLLWERVQPIFLFRVSFGLYFKTFFPSPVVNMIFGQISINAP